MSTPATAAAAGHHTAPASHEPCRASASSPLEQRCNSRNQTLVEYLWLSANGQELRSKTRVLDAVPGRLEEVPDWVVEGGGAIGPLYLKPRTLHPDPFRAGNHLLVLCDTHTPPVVRDDGAIGSAAPHASNNRAPAAAALHAAACADPVFSVEQQYMLLDPTSRIPLGWPSHTDSRAPAGKQYSAAHHQPPLGQAGGVGYAQAAGRQFSEAHLRACIHAGLDITGTQAEAVPGQWAYTLGPCYGIVLADQLWMSRFILHRLSEHFKLIVSLDPKPVPGAWPGSGAAVTFSTRETREPGRGWYAVQSHVQALAAAHMQHIMVYGSGNDRRLSGCDRTSNLMQFSWGLDNAAASVSVSHSVLLHRAGGYEDRRPAANMDPYLVTMMLVCTTCGLPLPVSHQGATAEESVSEVISSDILEEMDLLDTCAPDTPPQAKTPLTLEASSDNFDSEATSSAGAASLGCKIGTARPQVHGGRQVKELLRI